MKNLGIRPKAFKHYQCCPGKTQKKPNNRLGNTRMTLISELRKFFHSCDSLKLSKFCGTF